MGQTEKIIHPVAVAPPHEPPAAEARVGPHQDPHPRPDLTEPPDQQLQNRPAMFGGVYVGRPQVGHQQRLAAKDIERQVTIGVIVPVEEAALLGAVEGVVGGVEVEDQFFGRRAVGGDERLDEDLGHPDKVLAAGHVLQPRERRRRGRRFPGIGRPLGQHLQERIVAKRLVVVLVFVSEGQTEEALPEHGGDGMGDGGRVASVVDAGGQAVGPSEAAVHLAQQQTPGIGGQVAAVKIRLDAAVEKSGKGQGLPVTRCHRDGLSFAGMELL